MKRDVDQLSKGVYDLLVIGGGIYGACVAWDAALRGLSVALVEKKDFGHATSSNTLRIIHGGLRYLQHGDIRRMRQSTRERTAFMRIAPHLVHPVPFVIPAYGHSTRGKSILSLALLLYDLISSDRSYLEDPQKHLPQGRVISREECLQLFPGVEKKDLTGGAVLYDCQMSSSERLILSFIRAAAGAGADMANYVEVAGLTKEGTQAIGARVREVFTGEELEVRGRIVVNSSGPWLDRVLGSLNGRSPRRRLVLSKAFNLMVNRQLVSQCAVGIYARARCKDRDAIFSKRYRLYFITPWRDRSLIGTVHLPFESDPDHLNVNEKEIQDFIDEINEAYPTASLTRRDVCFIYSGLLPAARYAGGEVQLLKNYRLYDHEKEDGVRGIISVSGVKFTEARYVAEKTVDLVFRKLGRKPPRSATVTTPLYGGQIEQLGSFVEQEVRRKPSYLSAESVRHLIYYYGSAYPGILKYLPECCQRGTSAEPSQILEAEVLHAVREEMAQKLTDVIFRRIDLGTALNAQDTSLRMCAAVMSKELGWDATKTQSELDEAQNALALRT